MTQSLPIFTPLGQAAIQMHELVLEYQQVGFTREEAIHIMLELIKTIMSKGQAEGKAEGEEEK